MEKDVIVLVGAGKGGRAILETLVNIKGIEIRYVYDKDPNAPGMVFAREHNIKCLTDASYAELIADDDVDLVLEVTGLNDVFRSLRSLISPKGIVIGSSGCRIIFHLLDEQQSITRKLENLRGQLEQKIVERTEDLEKVNKVLHAKIMAYESLNEKLQQAVIDKTKYLLQATHQLKAPFAAIQSYVDIVLDGYAGDIPEQTADVLQKVKVRCDVLSQSIREMLELANLQTCRIENVARENINIDDVIRETIQQFDVIAAHKGVAIDFKPASDGTVVRCNAEQAKTLFSILLDNAINYSHDNARIEIETGMREGEPYASIADHGIGIAREKLDKIFVEFYRTNAGAEKHSNGSGLGLSIAREIAKLNGFSIGIDSEVGKGTNVIVTMQRGVKD